MLTIIESNGFVVTACVVQVKAGSRQSALMKALDVIEADQEKRGMIYSISTYSTEKVDGLTYNVTMGNESE